MEYLMVFGAMALILLASMGIGSLLEMREERNKSKQQTKTFATIMIY